MMRDGFLSYILDGARNVSIWGLLFGGVPAVVWLGVLQYLKWRSRQLTYKQHFLLALGAGMCGVASSVALAYYLAVSGQDKFGVGAVVVVIQIAFAFVVFPILAGLFVRFRMILKINGLFICAEEQDA